MTSAETHPVAGSMENSAQGVSIDVAGLAKIPVLDEGGNEASLIIFPSQNLKELLCSIGRIRIAI